MAGGRPASRSGGDASGWRRCSTASTRPKEPLNLSTRVEKGQRGGLTGGAGVAAERTGTAAIRARRRGAGETEGWGSR